MNEIVQSPPWLLVAAFAAGALVSAMVFGWRSSRLKRQVRQLEAQRDDTAIRLARLQAYADARQHEAQALEQTRLQLTHDFRQLADQLLHEKSTQFAVSNETLLRPFREQIESFQKRVNQIHDETQRGHATLGSEIRRVAEMGVQIGKQADSLATALRGESKTAGNWGEMLLERCLQLAGLEKDVHYRVQPSYATVAGQRLQPDVVVDLPDHKAIVIDSKVSLADYDLAVASGDAEAAARHLDAHVRAVRRHVDDLAGKGYARLPEADSPGFVLMYMPVEAAAMAALRHSTGLIEYAWRKNVMLVSTSTLMPVLRLIASAWATDRTHREAGELARQAGDIHDQMVRVAERFRRLGATLGTASRHYNDTVTALAGQQGLVGKISRFSGLASQARQDMPALPTLSGDHAEAGHVLDQIRENPGKS